MNAEAAAHIRYLVAGSPVAGRTRLTRAMRVRKAPELVRSGGAWYWQTGADSFTYLGRSWSDIVGRAHGAP